MQRIITITGPDGAGKSSVADALADVLSARGEVQRFHHRLRGLPSSEESRRATTTPQDNTPYGRITSTGKLLYLFADDLVGWMTKARPVLRRGGSVIVERGWWDLLVDPKRYRLRDAPRLTRLLGRALPGRRVTVILDAPASVMRARKAELPTPEIARQLEVWRDLAETLDDALLVSVDRPLAEVNEEVIRLTAADQRPTPAPQSAPDERWISLGGASRRLTLSTATRRTALSGLDLYQPMRVADLLAWQASRIAAAAGLLRVLPRVPEPRVRRILEDHVPLGGTVSLLCGNSPDRAVAALLDSCGRVTGIAKVAFDEGGRAKLAAEAEATTRFGSLLEAPLSAPSVRAVGDGVVVFEFMPWRPRVRPWVLEAEVAHSLGRLHRATLDGSTALGHGDFAPWNIMRSTNGWHVIDWEEARADRPHFEDVFHFVVQAHALLGHPTTQEVLDGVGLSGSIGRAIRAYAEGAEADVDEVPQRFVEYLRSSQQSLLSRPDREAGVVARQDLLAHLRPPLLAGPESLDS